MASQRIVSFLPAATEIICALGLRDRLVGVTHECDYPTEVRGIPVVVRSAVQTEVMSPAEIDVAVTERLRAGDSLYLVDEARLRGLEPDLIVTQDLCQVCAPSGNEVVQVLRALPTRPEILWLTPRTMAEIEDNIRVLGAATGTEDVAVRLIDSGRSRLARVADLVSGAPERPRVFCLEWVDPVYCSGHWVPEMVELAGGVDALGRRGTDSVRISWEEVIEFAPDVLVVMPCGYSLAEAVRQVPQLATLQGWNDLPAVRAGRVHAVDANAYFARPGPRVITGVELLAHILHPSLVPWTDAATPFHTFGTRQEATVGL